MADTRPNFGRSIWIGTRVAMGRRWFWSHCDTTQAKWGYTVRDDAYFDRLVDGFTILSGRWFEDVSPEALFKLLSGRDINLAAVRTSGGHSLMQALKDAGYTGEGSWQCSKCDAFMKAQGSTGMCSSCAGITASGQRRPVPPAAARS